MEYDYFIGRQKEIDEIITRIKYQNQSSALKGESGFGKTAILKHISNPVTLSNFKLPPNIFILVYLACPDPLDNDAYSPAHFWRGVFDALRTRLNQPNLNQMARTLSTQTEFDYFTIETFFYEAKREHLNIILLLDDFDNFLINPKFDYEFLWALKNLANNKIDYSFGLVVSTLTQLSNLCHDSELLTSPFFNIFSNVNLSSFSNEESLQFLNEELKKVKSSSSMNESQKSHFIRLSGGIPLVLQLIAQYQSCPQKVDEFISGQKREWDKSAIPIIERLLRRYWRNSGQSEKQFMQIYAKKTQENQYRVLTPAVRQELYKKFKDGWQSLIKRGLADQEDLIMSLFPDFFSASF